MDDQKTLFLGIELGGTTCVAALANKESPTVVLDSFRVPTTDPETTMGAIVEWANQKKDEIVAVGIATFGPVELDKNVPDYGCIKKSTPKEAFGGANIVGFFKHLNVPIHFETDVNAPAYAELKYGGHKKTASVVYVTVGTGVGVGAVINGLPVHGLMHMEGGHFNPRRKPGDDYAGALKLHPDSLESLICSRAVAERANVTIDGLQDLDDDHPVWSTIAYYLSELCVTATYMLSPHVIVLGGGVMNRGVMIPMIREYVTQTLNGYIAVPRVMEEMDQYICRSQFGSKSGLIGAISMCELALAES